MSPPKVPGRPERIVVGLKWAATELGISYSTARRLADDGELPGAFRVGRSWRVSVPRFRAAIDDAVEREASRLRHPTAGPLSIVADAPEIPPPPRRRRRS